MRFFELKRSLLRLGISAVLCPSQGPTQMGPVLSQIAHRIYILGMNHLSGGDQVSQNLLKENTEERTLKQGESLERRQTRKGIPC